MTVPRIDQETRIGRAVGWKLHFPDVRTPTTPRGLAFNHASHYAEIEVSLSGRLTPGSRIRAVIEGVNTADFGALASARAPRGEGLARGLVKMEATLFWRDRVGDEPSETRAPKTAVFAVTSLSRLAEGVRVKTVIEGRCWIVETLARAEFSAGQSIQGLVGTLRTALETAGLTSSDFVLHPNTDSGTMEGFEVPGGTPVMQLVERVGDRLAEAYNRRGRSLFLVRGGRLHAGPERPIPFSPTSGQQGSVITLDHDDGLIDAVNMGERRPTTAELRREASSTERATVRDAYRLSIAGRPDLKPGDVVRVPVDGSEVETFGGFGLPPLPAGTPSGATRQVYLNSVEHRLGKNRGWLTTATGVTVRAEELPGGVWDVLATRQPAHQGGQGSDDDAASPAETFVHHIRREARSAMETRERPRVGEVRANHQSTTMDGERVAEAAQSLDLLIGLEPLDGQPRRARRQDLLREDELQGNIPYLTPFAWGQFGLVLPHYPGERVLVAYHEDNTSDPVVLGSTWQTANDSAANAPRNVSPGDWWLILPAGVATDRRQSRTGTDAAPPPSDAKSVHDLIDATGARIIQMKELTIRTLPDNELGGPDTRPSGGANGGILITHKDGAKIHIASDGAITIHAKKNLVLKSDQNVEIEGKEIKLKGDSVDVTS